MRKIATLRTVKDISPIKGADRIQEVSLNGTGWRIVTAKDRFKVGEEVVFFEVDSFLPENIEAFKEVQKFGQKTVTHKGENVIGHLLRTARLRGVWSQGLILPKELFNIPEDKKVGDDVTEYTGAFKYEEPIPAGDSIIGPFYSMVPKTSAERVQNLIENWDEIKELNWDATVKIDGTSRTLMYDKDEERFRLFGRNWELDPDKASGVDVFSTEMLQVLKDNPNLVVQYELAGPKISGNRLKLSEQRGFIFSVWRDGVKIDKTEWPSVLKEYETPSVSLNITDTVYDALEKVSNLKGSITPGVLDEGVVLHLSSEEEKPDWLGDTRTIKLISNKYLIEHGL